MKKFAKIVGLILSLALAVCAVAACASEEGGGGETQPEVVSISLDTTGVKKEFVVGETFTAAGLKVTAELDDGSQKAVALSDCTVTEPNMVSPGTKDVVVSYGGKSASYSVTLREFAEATMTGIEVDASGAPREFRHNGTFSYEGLSVKAQYDDGSVTGLPVDSCTVTPPDLTTVGQKQVVVRYGEFHDEYEITVYAVAEGITVDADGAKCDFEQDDPFTSEGISVSAQMSDGTSKPVEEGFTVSVPDMSEAGDKTVTVSYDGKTDSYTVHVAADSRTEYRFEAESEFVQLFGGDRQTADFKVWTAGEGSDASGGKYLGGLNNNYQAKVVFRVQAEAETTACLKIRMAIPAKDVSFAHILRIEVGGVPVPADFIVTSPKESGYETFMTYRIGEIDLEAGVNEIAFLVPASEGTENDALAGNTNLDCIMLLCDTAVTGYTEPEIEGTTYTFEAEDAVLSAGLGTGTHEETVYVSGFDINDGGRSITFRIDATAAGTVTLAARISADDADRSFSELASVFVNDVPVNNITAVVEKDSPKTWVGFREVVLANIRVEEGYNEIRFVSSNKIGGNFDYIKLTAPDGVGLSAHEDAFAPISPVGGTAYRFEAEDAYFSGGAGKGTDGDVSFVAGFDRFSRNVCFFVTAPEAGQATLSVRMAAGKEDAAFRTVAGVFVNGVRVQTDAKLTGSGKDGSWFDWTTVTLANIDLAAGENTIEFCAERGGNFDYIELVSASVLRATYPVSPMAGSTYTFEAWKGEIAGGASNFGDQYVGNYKPGCTVTVRVYAEEATNATLSVTLDANNFDMFYRDISKLTLNQTAVELGTAVVAGDNGGGGNQWENWTTVTLANVKLERGENVFVFTSLAELNFKSFELVSPVRLSATAFA